VLQRFPFVRGLLVTGGMSKNSTGPDGDVDWLILVEPGRVWTLKSLLQVFRRGLPEPLREGFRGHPRRRAAFSMPQVW